MKRLLGVLLFAMVSSTDATSQSPVALTHAGKSVQLVADSGRPLMDSIDAISQEYGLIVDYEDPIYSAAEAREVTAPEWRRAHPTERGAFDPTGGRFTAQLEAPQDSRTAPDTTIDALVEQYNRSTNPGQFKLIHTASHRLVVSGRLRSEDPRGPGVMDRRYQPDPDRQLAGTALNTLIERCSAASGVTLISGTAPLNALSQSFVPGFKEQISCREGLDRIVDAMPYALVIHILYDITARTYAVNITPASRIVATPEGTRKLVRIQKPTSK